MRGGESSLPHFRRLFLSISALNFLSMRQNHRCPFLLSPFVYCSSNLPLFLACVDSPFLLRPLCVMHVTSLVAFVRVRTKAFQCVHCVVGGK